MKSFVCIYCKQKKHGNKRTSDPKFHNQDICRTCAKELKRPDTFVCPDCGEKKPVTQLTKSPVFRIEKICRTCARKKSFYICEICGQQKDLKTFKSKKSLPNRLICCDCIRTIKVESHCSVCGKKYKHIASSTNGICSNCRYTRPLWRDVPLYEKVTDASKLVQIDLDTIIEALNEPLTPKQQRKLEELVCS
jgi:hypothetical protein